MRTHHLLLAGLIASAVAGSALAQGKADTGSSSGIDVNSATSGNRGASSSFDSGVKGGYSFQGGLPFSASGLPSLSPPPPSSATGDGPPGPPGRVRAGITAPE
ncbi:MAG: hypothetical protein J0J01_21410 [Reyranella sp.]|uniref:hypothetical protein n=1 Tax=Reyranella sp. TaxID=1929291 RepID=UPI001AD1D99E|nr:hypothetical protein [Reyranella sp.]MBN9089477.1 hypothetical protein [Reyranella sp.]